ncbi:uncharacterized protein [Heptranchias perlo]|uniref:uncharacterized protein isoform X3 n=1 Tax=Heptranchias perlo TaxID=212740 RepID=UPI00355A7F41
MDPPTACVSWHSPPPIHNRQNMPSSLDLEQNVIYSATKHSSTVLRRWRNEAASDQPSAFSQQMNRLQEEQRAMEQCKALKQIAQIVPHRVDRLYYLCGSHIPIGSKYEVDMATFRRLQMKRSSQETTTAQEGHKGLICKESEENEPTRSFKTQAVDSDSQDNPNKKCCPSLTPVFLTESAEESPEDLKGNIQQSNGGSLGSVQEDDKTVEYLSSVGEESPVAAMSPECQNQTWLSNEVQNAERKEPSFKCA